MTKCPQCGGDGFNRITETIMSGKCHKCNGTGEIVIYGNAVVSWDCPRCKGTGKIKHINNKQVRDG